MVGEDTFRLKMIQIPQSGILTITIRLRGVNFGSSSSVSVTEDADVDADTPVQDRIKA